MAALHPLAPPIRHQRQIDELVAHVNKGVALALAAQGELENPPVPVERLVDIADLNRDMVDTDETRLPVVAHIRRSVCWNSVAAFGPTDAAGARFTTKTRRARTIEPPPVRILRALRAFVVKIRRRLYARCRRGHYGGMDDHDRNRHRREGVCR